MRKLISIFYRVLLLFSILSVPAFVGAIFSYFKLGERFNINFILDYWVSGFILCMGLAVILAILDWILDG
jgi:hypothetical protein